MNEDKAEGSSLKAEGEQGAATREGSSFAKATEDGWLRARCNKCQNWFEYKPHLTSLKNPVLRHVCDGCRAGRKRWLNRKWKQKIQAPIRKLSENEDRAKPNEFMSRREIGLILGVDQSTVVDLERRALEKIRSSPKLAELYQQYKEAEMPHIGELIGALRTSAGDRMLEYQIEIMEWWNIYETAVQAGLVKESRQVKKEIASCQKLIEKELKRVE
jgi:DNA-directed RNA polymerase sigma subunit (sigma70/sigma32)